MSYTIENNIIKGQPVDFDFAALGGIGNIFFQTMKKNSQKIALIDSETGKQVTYDHILRNAIRTALVLQQKGIKKGDIVVGCSDNHLDASCPILAALFLGAIPCSIDPTLTYFEMSHIINLLKPKILFTIPPALGLIEEICRDSKVEIELVVFGTSERYQQFQSIIQPQVGEDEFTSVVSRDPKETAVIYCSSGTTGLIKACRLNHKYLILQSALIPNPIADEDLDLERRNLEWSKYKEGGGTILCYSCLYWITGGRILFHVFFSASTCVIAKQFDPKRFWDIVDKYKVFATLITSFAISELARYGKPNNGNSLMKIFTGGTIPHTSHWKVIQEFLPDVDIIQNYGTTETGVIGTYEGYNKFHREYYKTHPDSLGFPVRGVSYKVVDPDTDKVLGPNQEGELLLKSEFFMDGFYNQPYEDAFDKGDWFRTGDIVYYTDNCALYLVDRLKEQMKYKQLIVYPVVIEHEILKHPAVVQAAVVGLPHEDYGDLPAAFVVLKKNSEGVTAEEIRKFADERTQDKAKLRGGLRIVDSLPMTVTGKVKRLELRSALREA